MTDSVLGVQVGDTAVFEKTVSDDDIAELEQIGHVALLEDADIADFAHATGDKQQLHLSDVHAAKTRFKRRIAHGMLSAGFISAALGTKLAPHATVIYLSQSLRFLRPVYPGDTITAQLEVTKIDTERSFVTCSTECVNQDGTSVLTGEATVLLEPLR